MAMTNINIGSAPNDGTGQNLRSAFETINSNNADIQAQLDGKSPVGHTHPISDVNGLQGALNTLQTNINNIGGELVNYAGTDVYDLINDLQGLITAQNAVIQQQSDTIAQLNISINDIISNCCS